MWGILYSLQAIEIVLVPILLMTPLGVMASAPVRNTLIFCLASSDLIALSTICVVGIFQSVKSLAVSLP